MTLRSDLAALIDSHDTQHQETIDALHNARGDLEAARAELAAANTDLTDARGGLTRQAETIGQLEARIAELEQLLTEPTPAPRRRPLLGTCGRGGMSDKSINLTTDLWGKGIAVRIFSASGWTKTPALGDAARLLASWKPDLTRPIDEAVCLAALETARPGTKVCVWHEPDVKVRQGADPQPMIDRSREFARIVRQHRPDLVLMGVLSAYTFHPTKGFKPEGYLDPSAVDVLGIDLDGSIGYHDYRSRVAKMLDWISAVGIARWTVAEYGTELTTGFGPSERAAWLREQTDHLLTLANPPEEICLFDSATVPGYVMAAGAPDRQLWLDYITG